MWSYCACLCKAVMRAFREMESVHSKKPTKQNRFGQINKRNVSQFFTVINNSNLNGGRMNSQDPGFTYRVIIEYKLYCLQLDQFTSTAVVTQS